MLEGPLSNVEHVPLAGSEGPNTTSARAGGRMLPPRLI